MEINHKKLKSIMLDRCMNIRQLAKKAGVSEATINLIINHSQRKPGISTVGKIAKALGVPGKSLLDESEWEFLE